MQRGRIEAPPARSRRCGRAHRGIRAGTLLVACLLAAAVQPAAASANEAARANRAAVTPVAAPPAAVSSAAVPSVGAPPPLYRTRIPPSAVLHYVMQRGILRGRSSLVWHRSGDAYTLQLDGSVAGLRILRQTSEGGFDAAGLAPRRFSDQRLRGEVLVADFDRTRGLITFSDSPQQLPLLRGMQDRLSWMIQLAAIASADAAQWVPGARISMAVVGARADPAVWTLRYVGPEDVETGAGTVQAVRLERVGSDSGDKAVEVWLDPRHDYLPIRASLHSSDSGPALELTLQEMVFDR